MCVCVCVCARARTCVCVRVRVRVCVKASWVAIVVKNPPASAGDVRDVGCITGSGRSPGGGYGNPFQYSCLENPLDRGDWRATVHGVTKSWTGLKQLGAHTDI